MAYARMGAYRCPPRGCGGVRGLGEDPLDILRTIPLVTPGTHVYATDPAYYLTPAARIQPWVSWLDQEFIKGVSNKTLLIGAGVVALLAVTSGGGGKGRR